MGQLRWYYTDSISMTETHCRLSKAILFQASRYSSESGQDRFKFSQEQAVKLRYLRELESNTFYWSNIDGAISHRNFRRTA